MTSSNATAWAGTDTHTDAHTIALLDEKGKAAGHRDIRVFMFNGFKTG